MVEELYETDVSYCDSVPLSSPDEHIMMDRTLCYNNIGRNGSFFNMAGYLIGERRRWPIINAFPRGQCSR